MSALPPDTTAYVLDYQEERSRLTTFFRFFTVLPHALWLTLWAIPAYFVLIAAWFTVVITGRYPDRMYHYLERFIRYSTFVNSYAYLATDAFPQFNGNPDTPYAARFLLGPPKEHYSRAKAFFRLLLLIPVYVVAYAFSIVAQIAAFCAWFVIVFTGRMPKGLHDLLALGLSYLVRIQPYVMLHTEAWPKFTDNEVAEEIGATTAGAIPPPPPPPPADPMGAPAATATLAGGFAPPQPGAAPPPPPPPAADEPATEVVADAEVVEDAPDEENGGDPPAGLTGGDPLTS